MSLTSSHTKFPTPQASFPCFVGWKLQAVSLLDFLATWKKRAPKECTWCAPSYFCVWSVHMCVCPQGSSGSVSRMKSECLVWSTVRSLYLTSDLRCDCPVKDLIESNLKRTNATRVAYRTPMLCDQLKRQRCLLSH